MSLRLGAVADDYTGASDLANTFSRNGLSTIQTIGVPPAGFDSTEVDAIVLAKKIRSIEASPGSRPRGPATTGSRRATRST